MIADSGKQPLRVAERHLSFDEAFQILAGFARRERGTLLYYDLGGTGYVQPSDGVRLEDIGRLTLMNPGLYGSEVATLLYEASSVPWHTVGHNERLEDADPALRGGLWDRALILYGTIDGLHGFGPAKTSKLLHIKRPYFYPVLDSYVLAEYKRAARRDLPGPVWEAVRQDLIGGKPVLNELRERLRSDDDLQVLARLSDVRLLDISAWSIGRFGLASALAR